MVKVSVITTCRKGENLTAFKNALKKQTFKDFELIAIDEGSIPEGFNMGVRKATGDILVITETDTIWNSPYLLDFVVKSVKPRQIATYYSECHECIALYKKDFIPFNEKVNWGNDALWFKQQKERGLKINGLFIHNTRNTFKKILKKSVSTPFNYIYYDLWTPKGAIKTSLFYISFNLIQLVLLPFAVLYKYFKNLARKFK